jgi:hypothetical protein
MPAIEYKTTDEQRQSNLRRCGMACIFIGATFFLFISAHPLGLVRPYPAPPEASITGLLGATKKINEAYLLRRPGEDLAGYLSRLSKDVGDGIVHYWHEGDQWAPSDARYTRPSIWTNYLLWLHPLIPGYEHFYAYEFMTPRKAIRRGYGFCSQVSRTVWSTLRLQGVKSEILNHPNHVIVQSNGHVLDADYGVAIPMTWQAIQSGDTAAIVRRYYRGFEAMHPILIQIYTDGWTSLGEDNASMIYMLRYEKVMDVLKWIPPLFIVSIGIGLLLLSRRTRRRGPFANM